MSLSIEFSVLSPDWEDAANRGDFESGRATTEDFVIPEGEAIGLLERGEGPWTNGRPYHWYDTEGGLLIAIDGQTVIHPQWLGLLDSLIETALESVPIVAQAKLAAIGYGNSGLMIVAEPTHSPEQIAISALVDEGQYYQEFHLPTGEFCLPSVRTSGFRVYRHAVGRSEWIDACLGVTRRFIRFTQLLGPGRIELFDQGMVQELEARYSQYQLAYGAAP